MKLVNKIIMAACIFSVLASCKTQSMLVKTKAAQKIQPVTPGYVILIDPDHEYNAVPDGN